MRYTDCCGRRVVSVVTGMLVLLFGVTSGMAAKNETIIDRWGSVEPPQAVSLENVKVDPGTTAFLILDIEERTCNLQRRPRCVASAPAIGNFLGRAREAGVFIVYSLTSKGTPATILPDVAPAGEEPIVQSSVDKFYGTELEAILKGKGIETVIIGGTTAEGAVIHTATAAAMRGFRVVVPVDGVSAGTLYAEQYTAWHLVNAPGSKKRTVLSRFDMITF